MVLYLDPAGTGWILSSVAANAPWSKNPLSLLQKVTRNTANTLLQNNRHHSWMSSNDMVIHVATDEWYICNDV